jgi:hypothetical protein
LTNEGKYLDSLVGSISIFHLLQAKPEKRLFSGISLQMIASFLNSGTAVALLTVLQLFSASKIEDKNMHTMKIGINPYYKA